MKSSSALVLLAAAACAALADAQDGSFSATEKALWVDRHNYFRMTALPFSAGNMLRVKWSDELAAAALADAKGCAAATGAGVNAHTHAAAASGNVIDAAFTEWAVNGAYSALAKIKAPSKDGEPVGTGVYNSYSQIVWAATNSVGCGYSTCTAGKLVVCKYSAAGNSANEPWYVHASPNTQCPAGTVGKQGLCIVEGDAGNNDIAAIPAGQNAYAVFASFIGNMHKVLLGQTVDGGPKTGGTSANTNPATTATPGAAATTTAPSAATGTTTTTTPSPVVTEATATKTPTTAGSTTSGGTTSTGTTTQSPTTTSGSTGGTATKSIDFGSLTNNASDAPGKVNAGSNTGTTFSNATPSAGGTSTAAAASSSSAKKTEKTESADESVTGGSGTANNKSDGGDAGGSSGFSAAGVAGAIVVGCVMVAGVFVFVSYRKNQQRQRDIMQNGGIHIL